MTLKTRRPDCQTLKRLRFNVCTSSDFRSLMFYLEEINNSKIIKLQNKRNRAHMKKSESESESE
jgi:hypothetical protein